MSRSLVIVKIVLLTQSQTHTSVDPAMCLWGDLFLLLEKQKSLLGSECV